jgi:hypothetical protein
MPKKMTTDLKLIEGCCWARFSKGRIKKPFDLAIHKMKRAKRPAKITRAIFIFAA